MSETPQTEQVEVEESSEENSDNIVVVDPDDYQRTQKLKAIQEAKDEYKRYKRNKSEILMEMKEVWVNGEEAYRRERGERIADYATELIPLIEEGIERGPLTEEDTITSLGPEYENIDIIRVAKFSGHVNAGDGELASLSAPNCDDIYRQLERIERKLGLGIELELDKGPAKI